MDLLRGLNGLIHTIFLNTQKYWLLLIIFLVQEKEKVGGEKNNKRCRERVRAMLGHSSYQEGEAIN